MLNCKVPIAVVEIAKLSGTLFHFTPELPIHHKASIVEEMLILYLYFEVKRSLDLEGYPHLHSLC